MYSVCCLSIWKLLAVSSKGLHGSHLVIVVNLNCWTYHRERHYAGFWSMNTCKFLQSAVLPSMQDFKNFVVSWIFTEIYVTMCLLIWIQHTVSKLLVNKKICWVIGHHCYFDIPHWHNFNTIKQYPCAFHHIQLPVRKNTVHKTLLLATASDRTTQK